MPKTHELREFILRILDLAERNPSIALAALAKMRFRPTFRRVAKLDTQTRERRTGSRVKVR